MSEVRILGIDPGFANIGIFMVTVTKTGETAVACRVVTTKPAAKKQRIHAYDDEHRRLEEIERAFLGVLDGYKPDIVATETFPSLRSASATRKIALVYGALHALARARGIPWRSYAPQEIKREITSKRSASKEEVFEALKSWFPGFTGWPSTKKVEHVADAGGAALSARHDHVVGMLLRERGQ